MNTSPNAAMHNQSNHEILEASTEVDEFSIGTDSGAVSYKQKSDEHSTPSDNSANQKASQEADTTDTVKLDKPFTDSLERNKILEELGETLGTFHPYDSQLPLTDIIGTRIVKCLYQAATSGANKGKKAQENAYVRIPTKHLTDERVMDNIAELVPFITAWLQDIEAGMIKENHRKGILRIATDYLDINKLIEHLEENASSSRLNKVMIEEWFDKTIADALAVKFATKLGLDENSSEPELARIELVLIAYKAKFSSLASPKIFIKESDCLAMVNVIKECGADNSLLGNRFIAKLGKMSEKQEDLLLSL